MITAATLGVTIGGNATGALAAMSRTNAAVEESRGKFGMLKNAIGMAMGQLMAQAATAVLMKIGQEIKSLVDDTLQLQMEMAQTATVLKSTGDASGMTAKGIRDMAVAMSEYTPFSDLAIQSTENLLLTFTTIGKNTFPQATQAILDVSQAMNEDLKSATIQIGKALDDPVRGMTALTRIGVTFDAQQRQQIKTMEKSGHLAQAQAIILKELEREFGGSAKAAGSTFKGALEILDNQFTRVKETIGTAVLPVLAKLFVSMQPAIQAFASHLPQALAAAGKFFQEFGKVARPILEIIGAHLQAAARIGAAVFQGVLMPAFRLVAQILQEVVFPALGALMKWFDAKIMPIINVVARAFISTLGPAIKSLQTAFADAQPQIQQLGQALQDAAPIIEIIAKSLGTDLVIAFKVIGLAIRVVAAAMKGIIEVITGAVHIITGLWNIISGIFTLNGSKIKLGMGQLGDGLGGIFGGIKDTILGILGALFGGVVNWLGQMKDKAIKLVTDMATGIVSFIAAQIPRIPYYIGFAIGAAIKAFIWLKDKAPQLLAEMVAHAMIWIANFVIHLPENIAAMVVKAVAWFDTMKTKAINLIVKMIADIIKFFHDLPSNLTRIGGQIIQGLVDGINNGMGMLWQAAQNIVSGFLNGIKNGLGIHSPSAAMHDLGGHTITGFINGLLSKDPVAAFKSHIKGLLQPITMPGLRLNGGALPQLPLGAQPLRLLGPMAGPQPLPVTQNGVIAGAGNQEVTLVLDGHKVGRLLLPHIATNIRQAVGVRVQ